MASLVEAVAALLLAVMGYYDVRQREVSVWHVAVSYAVVAMLHFLMGLNHGGSLVEPYMLVALNLVLAVVASVLALLKLWGWGDVAALGLAILASPTTTSNSFVMPTAVLVLLYSSIATIVFMLVNTVRNIVLHRKLLAQLPLRYRIVYTVIAKPVKAGELVEKNTWLYPLNLCGEYRVTFNIYDNPEDVARRVREAMARKCIDREDYVWATYGYPGIAYMALAYIAAIIAGDKPLIYLARHLPGW